MIKIRFAGTSVNWGIKKYFPAVIIIFCIVVISVVFFQKNAAKTTDDFTLEYDGKNYNVIVEKPVNIAEKYPLIIYQHGEGFETIEPFELREIAKRLAAEGFLVWVPERTPWNQDRTLQTLEEAEGIGRRILEAASKDQSVDGRDINLIGFSLGSWAFIKDDRLAEKVKSVTLVGFGAPFFDTLLYDRVFDLVNNGTFANFPAKVLIIVSSEDQMVNVAAAEILREKIVQAGIKVDCLVYAEGDHATMAGNNKYLIDIIKYLKGVKIDTVDRIGINSDIIGKWDKIWKTGYW